MIGIYIIFLYTAVCISRIIRCKVRRRRGGWCIIAAAVRSAGLKEISIKFLPTSYPATHTHAHSQSEKRNPIDFPSQVPITTEMQLKKKKKKCFNSTVGRYCKYNALIHTHTYTHTRSNVIIIISPSAYTRMSDWT